MFDPKRLLDWPRRLQEASPFDGHECKMSLKKTTRAITQIICRRLNLVSREEFDVQRKVLAKTREKLQQLEKEESQP